MTGRRSLVLGLALLAAVAVAAVFASRGDSRRSLYDGLSNRGRAVSTTGLLPVDRIDLDSAGVAELRVLADRGGLRFYRGTTAQGDSCVVLGRAVEGRERFGAFGCPSRFPSDDMPVADLTTYTQGLDDAYPVVAEVAGFAADGIRAVGIRTPGGDVVWAPVAGNVYLGHPQGVRAAALVVQADDGSIVSTTPVGGRTLRESYATAP